MSADLFSIEEIRQALGWADSKQAHEAGDYSEDLQWALQRVAEESANLSARNHLAKAIADAAQRAGIYNGTAPLTGPHLLMLCNDLGDAAAVHKADVELLDYWRGYAGDLEAECRSVRFLMGNGREEFCYRVAKLLNSLHRDALLSEEQCAECMGVDLLTWRKTWQEEL